MSHEDEQEAVRVVKLDGRRSKHEEITREAALLAEENGDLVPVDPKVREKEPKA